MALTETQKMQIIQGDKDGKSGRTLSDETGVPRSTIGDFLRKETYQGWWASYEGTPQKSTKLQDMTVKVTYEVEPATPRLEEKMDNSRILLISDMHVPYHHPDTLSFLAYLKKKYQPTRVICLGDELDKHSLSFHDSDPDLPSAGEELLNSLPTIQQVKEMFPVMDVLDSNHGSLVYRKAKAHGIPRHYIKSYNDVLGVDDNWKWHFDLTIELPNGQKCYFHHGKLSNVTKVSQQMGMNCVQGHFHETFKIEYWGNPTGLYWALQIGCLIDDKSYAFSYNNVNVKRPIIGTGLIIDSLPVLEPMILNEQGRWVGPDGLL